MHIQTHTHIHPHTHMYDLIMQLIHYRPTRREVPVSAIADAPCTMMVYISRSISICISRHTHTHIHPPTHTCMI